MAKKPAAKKTPRASKPRAAKAAPKAPPPAAEPHEPGRYGKARMRGYLPGNDVAPADAADSEGGEL